MTASLEVPTATSFRVVPARLLEVNRRILNNQLSRTGSAGKVSFTHLIGFAVVEALQATPVMNSSFVPADPGRPQVAAVGRPPRAHRPRARGRPRAARRQPHPAGAGHQGRRRPRLPGLLVGLRGPDPQGADQQDRRRRPERGDGHPDQPRHDRHGAVGAPAHARAGRHRRRRCHRLPGRVAGRRPEGAGRARRLQGGRPSPRPTTTGSSRAPSRAVPPAGPPAADRGGRLLRAGVQGHGRALRAGALPPGHQRHRRGLLRPRPASRSRWTTSSTCTGSGAT